MPKGERKLTKWVNEKHFLERKQHEQSLMEWSEESKVNEIIDKAVIVAREQTLLNYNAKFKVQPSEIHWRILTRRWEGDKHDQVCIYTRAVGLQWEDREKEARIR